MLKRKLRDWFHAIVEQEMDRVPEAIRASPTVEIAQCNLIATWRQCLNAGITLPLHEVGFRAFSQSDEDGILLYLFTAFGAPNRTFIELGAADGIRSNCANLAINHGWTGLFVDGDLSCIEHGRDFYSRHRSTRSYPPTFVQQHIDRDNVNEIVRDGGFDGDVDLLSIDIDGNDYWVWESLDCISPRVVVIETHTQFGMKSIVVPYDKDHVYPGKHHQYHGASAPALAKLAKKKGYRLVGANYYGVNTIYVRNDVGVDLIPEVPVESILKHPRTPGRMKQFEEIKDWDYVSV
jgi:hypothetical protein